MAWWEWILWGPCFWVWLTSLSTMSSRSVHTLVSERGKLSGSPACKHTTFLFTFCQGTLESFRFLAIVVRGAMRADVQTSVPDSAEGELRRQARVPEGPP